MSATDRPAAADVHERLRLAGVELNRSLDALALELPESVYTHHRAVVDAYLDALNAVFEEIKTNATR